MGSPGQMTGVGCGCRTDVVGGGAGGARTRHGRARNSTYLLPCLDLARERAMDHAMSRGRTSPWSPSFCPNQPIHTPVRTYGREVMPTPISSHCHTQEVYVHYLYPRQGIPCTIGVPFLFPFVSFFGLSTTVKNDERTVIGHTGALVIFPIHVERFRPSQHQELGHPLHDLPFPPPVRGPLLHFR
jgi:hypothetical protein